MQLNEAGLNLIKEFEGCKLEAYQDQGGVWTIGYGSTFGIIHSGMEITQEEADDLLNQDIKDFGQDVTLALQREVSDDQFSAMVSLCYNIGPSNFRTSTLLRLVNEGDFEGAAKQFVRWDKIRGISNPGLLRRREAERDLFNLVAGT